MTNPGSSIHWRQLFSLAALYGSVIIGWIAYYRYQPRLLDEFGLSHLSLFLVVAQGVILVITPPIAGKLGDRYRVSKGHRIPIITAGMSFAAMIFMAVAFALISTPGEFLRMLLPIMIILWLIAMSIFTSPALSTIELFAPVDKLPLAMAVLTIVGNLVNALEPVIVDIIDYLGAALTFSIGGVAVFLSGYALKRTSLDLFKSTNGDAGTEESKKSRYPFIFFLGVGMGFATTVLFNLFPDQLEISVGPLLGELNGNMIVVMMLVLSALISVPLTKIVDRIGLKKSFVNSLVIVISAFGGIMGLTSTGPVVLFCLVFVFGFTWMAVSSLPLVIQEASVSEKVFCVGIFYSGVALPDGIVDYIMLVQ